MGMWNESPGDGKWGRPPEDEEPQQRYLGLSATQFNLAFFAAVGAIALAVFLYLGGAGVVQDSFGGGDDEPAAVSAERTPTATATRTAPSTTASTGSGSASAVSQALNTFDPFSLVSTLSSIPSGGSGTSGASSPQEGDSLKALLLREEDLPAGFTAFGEMSFAIPADVGTGTMAANMFASGDLASADMMGAMVMSAALSGPDISEGFSELQGAPGISQAELDELSATFQALGISFSEFRLLDASGLGDGGMGFHMVMDFGGLVETFGAPDDGAVPSSIAWDMYMFRAGERALMLMVMWPSDVSSGVDSRALAEALDAKSG